MDYKDIIKRELKKVSESKFSKLTDNQLSLYDSIEFKNGAINGGKKGGESNSKSGHISKLGKLNGKKNANSPKAVEQSKKQGKINAENKFWEKTTFEQRSKGGKTSYKKHVESGHWDNYIKLGTEASTKARIERGLLNKKAIIDSIETDIFDTATLRKACDNFGYKSWKAVLKEKSLVIQIHKGFNQFNPSLYKKVI